MAKSVWTSCECVQTVECRLHKYKEKKKGSSSLKSRAAVHHVKHTKGNRRRGFDKEVFG